MFIFTKLFTPGDFGADCRRPGREKSQKLLRLTGKEGTANWRRSREIEKYFAVVNKLRLGSLYIGHSKPGDCPANQFTLKTCQGVNFGEGLLSIGEGAICWRDFFVSN